MGRIIAPAFIKDRPTPFSDLLNTPQQFQRVEAAFCRILSASFLEDERRSGKEFVARIRTQLEERRRADILGKWFRILRGELGFGMIRTMDELPKALRKELDGETYTPPEKNRLWAPGGVAQC
jgi:hypothetical protein